MSRPIASLALACALLVTACAPPATLGTTRPLPSPPDPTSAPASTGEVAPALDAHAGTDVGISEEVLATYVRLASGGSASSQLGTFTGPLPNWPISGRTSSPFGPRWGGFHNGLDIAAPLQTPVQAAAAGQVVTVGKPALVYGDTATIVIIAHGTGFSTLYAHLNDERPPVVKVGQRVEAGQLIAYNGSTGWSTGPHVHFMTIVNGRAVNPLQYLP